MNRIVVAVVLVLVTLEVGAKTYSALSARETAIVRAERETLNATGVVAAQAARIFDGVSRALAAAGELRAAVDSGAVVGAEAIHDALKTIHGGSPVILGIGWTDIAGNRVASSNSRDPPPLNIADQDQFRVHRDDPAAGLYISAPIRSRLDGSWIIPISRRIDDEAGRFAGIVNAVLRIADFLEFYRAIDLGPDTGVLLVTRDGVLLAHEPMVEDRMGRPQAGGLMSAIASSGTRPANLHATGPIDGKERIFGYASIPGFPLAIAAGMSRHDALESWREALFWSAVEGVVTIAALVAGGTIIVIVLRRREAAARALEETGALLQSVFAVSNQATLVFDRDLRAVAWNELHMKLFGDTPAPSRGATLESILRAMSAGGEHGTGDIETFVAERLKTARSRLPQRYERERPNGSVVDVSWLPLPNGYLAVSHTDVTHRKRTEIALRASEAKTAQALARLSDAVDSLKDPFLLWDAEERLVLANAAALNGPGGEALAPGVRLEDVVAHRVKIGSFPAGVGREDEYIRERLAQIRGATGEPVEFQRRDGRWLAALDRRTREGGIVSLRVDITRLKRAEAELRESEAKAARAHARLVDAVDSLRDPFLLWDAEERLVLANAVAAKGPGGEALAPGVRLEDVVAHGVKIGSFPAGVGREDEYIRERLAQVRGATGEPVEIQRRDGRWLAALDRRTREGGIVSLRVDITRLKRAETALRESEAKAARAHARLVDAVDSLNDPFVLWDAEERLVLANTAAARGPGGEVLAPGVRLEDVIVHRVKAGAFTAGVGREEEFIRERLAQIRRADGEPVEVRIADGRWLLRRDLRTREGGLVNLIVDITEIKKREAELAAARQAADAASRAKSDFLSRMSHELRTPLNAVIGFAQLLQIDRRDTLTPRQQGYCRDIESGGHHLLALVNDVLDLARIESGKDRMSIERVSVADALSSLGAAMTALAAADGISLRIAGPAGVPDIRADDVRLHQVLLNLVSNAIKYNRKGGSVSVAATAAPGNRVRFVVADTGVGIAPELQAEMFEPFHRLGQEHSGIGGTGIGLSICKRLAEAMDGSIGLTSVAGEGSTFWIELPADTSAPMGAAEAPGPAPVETPADGGGFSLLYVEDNPASMRLMEHLVSILPRARLLTASTAQLGLDLAGAHRPALILLDLHMPGMDGYEMLTRLKAMPETRDVPVVALTAAAMPNDIRRGLAAGFFRYLTKPIDAKEFLAVVGECISLTDGVGGEDAELNHHAAGARSPGSAGR